MDGCSGERASRIAGQELLQLKARLLSFEEAETLLRRVRKETRPVAERRLRFLGKRFMGHYARSRATLRLKPGRGAVVAELPFTVEAWISSADEDNIDILVNRTPVTGEVDMDRVNKKTDVGIFGCGLRHRFTVGKKPIDVTLNIQIPYMP